MHHTLPKSGARRYASRFPLLTLFIMLTTLTACTKSEAPMDGYSSQDCDNRWVVQGGRGTTRGIEMMNCPPLDDAGHDANQGDAGFDPDGGGDRDADGGMDLDADATDTDATDTDTTDTDTDTDATDTDATDTDGGVECLIEAEVCDGTRCGPVYDHGCQVWIDCGSCTSSCEDVLLECGPNGHCVDDEDGNASCACGDGYTGPFCQECDVDYRLESNQCVPDCRVIDADCSDRGECVVEGEWALCVCEEGYGGPLCETCADGYQDNDGDGVCRPACDGVTLDCGTGGVCSDATGEAQCVCLPGYTGADCDECAQGYQDNNNDGECRLACDNEDVQVCTELQICDDSTGIARCTCPDGAGNDACTECLAGYQLVDQACVYAPTTCEEVLAVDPQAADGEQTLHYQGDVNRPWTAYCADMATGTPTTYLPFARTSNRSNYSMYTQTLLGIGSSVRTNYSRVVIDPETLEVRIGDQRFATNSSVGTPRWNGIAVTRMPYASAATCGLITGSGGNIDLRGTPFRVAPAQSFCSAALAASATYSSNRQVVTLGFASLACNWLTVNPCPENAPINDYAEGILQLEYITN